MSTEEGRRLSHQRGRFERWLYQDANVLMRGIWRDPAVRQLLLFNLFLFRQRSNITSLYSPKQISDMSAVLSTTRAEETVLLENRGGSLGDRHQLPAEDPGRWTGLEGPPHCHWRWLFYWVAPILRSHAPRRSARSWNALILRGPTKPKLFCR